MTRIWIEGDTVQEVQRAITAYDCVKFSQPQQSKNPRYAHQQKWFSYGTLQEPNSNSHINVDY